MPDLRVGLLGCGHVATVAHVPALRQIPAAEIAAIAEPVEDRLNWAQTCFPKAQTYSDFRPLIENESLDAVIIGLPSDLHAEAAILAMERGLHVYIEKPLAVDLPSARQVAEVWETASSVAMLGLNLRFNSLYHQARAIVKSGQLGALAAVRTIFGSEHRVQPSWRESHEQGGGALLNLYPHHIDLVDYLLETRYTSITALPTYQHDNLTLSVQFELANGLPGQSLLSMSSYSADEFQVIGERYTLNINRRAAKLELIAPTVYERRVPRLTHEVRSLMTTVTNALRIRGEPSYLKALSAFVTAAQHNDRSVRPNITEGLRVQTVLEAAWQSAATGQSVRVEEP